MYGLISKMTTTAGQRDVVLALMQSSTGTMPGCQSYVLAKDPTDDDAIWITEIWDDRESHLASLALPEVQETIAKARPMITGFGHRFETEPVAAAGSHNRSASVVFDS